MAGEKHTFDRDFEAINFLFEEYAKSIKYENVKDFKSATKTKLTNKVWEMLYKNPKNKYDMEHNAADFVKALNNCLSACMKKIQNGTFCGSFSQYIYDTIPKMIKRDPDAKSSARTKSEYDKIKKIQYWYEDYQKRGKLTHIQIIKKISILMGLSENDVDNYVKSRIINSTSDALYKETYGEESNSTIVDLAVGSLSETDNPEKEFELLSNLNEVLESLNKQWLLISDDVERKCLSDLLTEFLLRSYKTSYRRDCSIFGSSQVFVDFDLERSCEKYSFLNKNMIFKVISSDDKSLPGQWDIGKMYYPDIKKDAVNHKVKRFIAKAIEKLK